MVNMILWEQRLKIINHLHRQQMMLRENTVKDVMLQDVVLRHQHWVISEILQREMSIALLARGVIGMTYMLLIILYQEVYDVI